MVTIKKYKELTPNDFEKMNLVECDCLLIKEINDCYNQLIA